MRMTTTEDVEGLRQRARQLQLKSDALAQEADGLVRRAQEIEEKLELREPINKKASPPSPFGV